MNFDAIIFDLDGTLVDSAGLIQGAFNHITGKYLGRHYRMDEITPFFGPSEDDTWRRLLPAGVLEEALAAYYKYYEDNHLEHVKVFEGIPELLRQLSDRGTPLAINTGRGQRTTAMTLRLFGLEEFFRSVVTGDVLQRPKPDPESVRLVCEQLEVGVENTLMIGDSPMDIEAGHAAGAKTAAVFWGTFGLGGDLKDCQADYRFERPPELADFLLNGRVGH
jgi:pyrophosphatase PpaX